MSNSEKVLPGSIAWIDVTVPDADKLRHFYSAVAGWRSDAVDMGGYQDYTMRPVAGGPVAGICHKRGVNQDLPPVWMIYINVINLEASVQRCRDLGGKVLIGPYLMEQGNRVAVIEDPAGVICALYQAA
jgi:uncharacterized protein